MTPQLPVTDTLEAGRIERQRQFVRAMSKSIEGQTLEQSERTLLERIFAALVRGDDVSNLTGIKRPHTRRTMDPIHIALHYLCLTRMMGTRPVMAWDIVGEAWRLNRRDVQRLIVQNRVPALAALPRFADDPDRLLRICEQHAHAAGAAHDRSATSLPAQSSGDRLIRMLTQLLQNAAAKEGTAA
jgi:hypothetical protein